MHTLIAILLSTVLDFGQPAPERQHFDIFIVSGQSNARAMYADGIQRAIEDSHLYNNPVVFHRNHSGQPISRWVTGVGGVYEPAGLFFSDFWSTHHTSGLETLIRSIRDNGDTFAIKGFFWFQGESDSGFYGEISEYSGRFRFMLDQIKDRHNHGRPFPFVITVVDYNHDLEHLFPYSPKIFDLMRQTQTLIAEDDPFGLVSDSRGWPRLDLWHVGDLDHPSGQYGPVFDLGYEQGVALTTAFGPEACLPDLSRPYRLLDILDIESFYQHYQSGRLIAGFSGDGRLDSFDVFAFFEAFVQGCPDG